MHGKHRSPTSDGRRDRPDDEHRCAVIVHELRSPVTVALSAVETLAALQAQPRPDREQVDRVVAALRRQMRLAAKLLDRLDLAEELRRGEVELDRISMDLVQLVDEIAEDVATFVLPTVRRVIMDVDGPLVFRFDAGAIAEIVFNLLVNADKYSPEGSDIDVRVGSNNGSAEVVVRDRGAGLSETQGDIFDAYVQGEHRRGGAGLGLYVSRGLARAHGGDLYARAAAGRGSEFVLTLPVHAR